MASPLEEAVEGTHPVEVAHHRLEAVEGTHPVEVAHHRLEAVEGMRLAVVARRHPAAAEARRLTDHKGHVAGTADWCHPLRGAPLLRNISFIEWLNIANFPISGLIGRVSTVPAITLATQAAAPLRPHREQKASFRISRVSEARRNRLGGGRLL